MATVRHIGFFPTKDQAGTYPDGTPVCFVGLDRTQETGAQTFYPLGVPLREAMRWYWLVKKWKIEFTFTIGDFSGSGSVTIPANTVSVDDDVLFPIENEKELVCPKSTVHENRQTDLNIFNFALFDRQVGSIEESPFSVLKKNNLFYVNLFFDASVTDLEFEGNAIMADGYMTTQQSDLYELQGGGSLVFDGHTIPTQITQGFTFNGEITIDEYWEYNPQDGGGPIYDKKTGKLLRPFPSLLDT